MKWGTLYGSEYVNKLYNGITRNTSISIKFICFTDNTEGIHSDIICEPLPTQFNTLCWGKLHLFNPELGLQGKVVFIDLDMIITGNIDSILLTETVNLYSCLLYMHIFRNLVY